MRKFLLMVLLLTASYFSRAQQLHFTSQFMQHNPMYNPAAAGISNKNMVGLSYRNMWESFPGNPTTYMAYGDVQLRKMNAGLGAYIYRDQTGPSSRTGAQVAYSYHINPRSEKYKIGLGLELRGLQYAIDKTKISASLGNDPVLSGAASKFAFDAGAGVYFTNYKLSVGAAVSQLMGSKLELANVPGVTTGGKLYRHYNLTANYKWNTGDDMYLIPNALVRVIENSPAEFDFGMLAKYHDLLWWGVNYRVGQSWCLQAGIKILKKATFCYSYDYYKTPISIYTGGAGAHELGLQFDLNK
jgi:type IX secretion system PorP/SprF family membrane protein